MIHRAILGSVERMFAILLEHYKGKWPFWISPRQAIVCPVTEKLQSYALQVISCHLSLLLSEVAWWLISIFLSFLGSMTMRSFPHERSLKSGYFSGDW